MYLPSQCFINICVEICILNYLDPESLAHIFCHCRANLIYVMGRHNGIESLLYAVITLETSNSVIYDNTCDIPTSRIRVDLQMEIIGKKQMSKLRWIRNSRNANMEKYGRLRSEVEGKLTGWKVRVDPISTGCIDFLT